MSAFYYTFYLLNFFMIMSKVSSIILSDIETISENETISDNEFFELLDEQVFFIIIISC